MSTEMNIPEIQQASGGFCMRTGAAPCGFVIFGASGELSHGKLLPALFKLHSSRLLSDSFFVLGAARTPMTDESFRASVREAVSDKVPGAPATELEAFLSRVSYVSGDYADAENYRRLGRKIEALEGEFGTGGSRLFYFATPPGVHSRIARGLAAEGLTASEAGRSARVVVEKPFGSDSRSAFELNDALASFLEEDRIYRIDHYLGKETVQNILMFRFANAVFEPLWNRRYVDHVQITVSETIGVGERAGYFEGAGLVRDMFQSHMLQLLAVTAMEPPISFAPERVRDERVRVLRSIRPIQTSQAAKTVVRARYVRGTVEGLEVPGYIEEKGVAPSSRTETYAAIRFFVDNWRWQGVPFYLRSGKRLAQRVSEISVVFRPVPHSVFSPLKPVEITQNVLVLRVQPHEGVSLNMLAKKPGFRPCMMPVALDFAYHDYVEGELPDAYSRLILDAIAGDPTLFWRRDGLEASWKLIDPIVEAFVSGTADPLEEYESGSTGPVAAEALLEQDGRSWLATQDNPGHIGKH